MAHVIGLKERYYSMIPENDQLHGAQLKHCGDLKVIVLLLGMQHMCLLCLWNSRDNISHYIVKEWHARTEHTVGRFNVPHQSLVDAQKVYLPPLNIKLAL